MSHHGRDSARESLMDTLDILGFRNYLCAIYSMKAGGIDKNPQRQLIRLNPNKNHVFSRKIPS